MRAPIQPAATLGLRDSRGPLLLGIRVAHHPRLSDSVLKERDGSRAGGGAVSAAPVPIGRSASLYRGGPISLCIRKHHGHICLLHLPICSLHNIESGKDTASTDRSFPSC